MKLRKKKYKKKLKRVKSLKNLKHKQDSKTHVAFCIAFIAAAPVLNASTVSVVALAPSNIIICNTN